MAFLLWKTFVYLSRLYSVTSEWVIADPFESIPPEDIAPGDLVAARAHSARRAPLKQNVTIRTFSNSPAKEPVA